MRNKFFVCLLIFTAAAGNADIIRTAHYEIDADTGWGESAGRQMEALFEAYNRVFRFDPAAAVFPLKVKIFTNTDEYNNYVNSRFTPVNPEAVYLHYAQTDRRELAIDRSHGGTQALPVQAFFQFFRAFVSQPPAWMERGFAVFFSGLSFNGPGIQPEIQYEENLAWLVPVKSMKIPLLETIFLGEGGGEGFQALSWSLVSFFLNCGKEEYTRALTDSFMTLSNAASAAGNAQAAMKRILLGTAMEDLIRDYRYYLESRKTFAELVTEGQSAYSLGDTDAAQDCFLAAMKLKSRHYAPYYYLGLLAYGKKEFEKADQLYLAGIYMGLDQAAGFYALGVNAAAAGKSAEAADYLGRAARLEPGRYREKADNIIRMLPQR
jgi:tetratricopeptide (TPR) repeat protein